MNVTRVLPVFSIVLVVAYAVAMHFNLAPFTYYPSAGRFAVGIGKPTPELGPAMYWYGWLSVALIVAVAVAVVGFAVPERLIQRAAVSGSWVIALAVITFFLWDLRSWFIH